MWLSSLKEGISRFGRGITNATGPVLATSCRRWNFASCSMLIRERMTKPFNSMPIPALMTIA